MPETELADELLATAPDELRDQALRRLKKRRDFHTHLVVYLTINALLWAIWLLTGADGGGPIPWPLWPTLGWGIGVFFNAWDVYVRRPITEEELQREVQRLVHH